MSLNQLGRRRWIRGYIAAPIRLDCGSGDDAITGGIARDEIRGGEGNDTLYGNAGADSLWGGDGDDRFDDVGDRDVHRGESGDDRSFIDGRRARVVAERLEAIAIAGPSILRGLDQQRIETTAFRQTGGNIVVYRSVRSGDGLTVGDDFASAT